MKKFYTLVVFLFVAFSAIAQTPGLPQDTTVYRITDNDVKRFVSAHQTMNLTEADFTWMRNNPYESNKNAEVYQRILKGITSAGFKDYVEYSKVAQRVAYTYGYDQNGGISDEQNQQLEEAINNPNIPDQYKAQIREQVEYVKRQTPTAAEIKSITPYKKYLESLFEKYGDEG